MPKHLLKRIAIGASLLVCIHACREPHSDPYVFQKNATSRYGMVVSAHPLATQAGVRILQKGGNAVDASIAVQLALAVVYPRAGNIGGGGFMLYRSSTGEITALDYREKAPLASSRDMYLDSVGNVIPGLSLYGTLAAGVPGTVAGLRTAHQKYGSLPWEILFSDAIRLAREGHPLTSFEANRLNAARDEFIKWNGEDIPFVSDSIWHAGDILVQTDLAASLERISASKTDGFYAGPTAEYILETMRTDSGLISMEDLSSYEAVWRKPVQTEYRGYRISSMPSPSSGGIALAQMLEMLEPYPLSEWGNRDIRTIHLMTEVERRAFADRATHLGDADFIHLPIDTLLDEKYLLHRMQDFQEGMASKSESIHAGAFEFQLESFETTHLTVTDSMGNAVAVTTTLNGNYGSKVYVKGAGFFLNNEMDDFSTKPGVPNMYGLIGGEANAIEPGKRMLSSMTPTIVEKDNAFFMTIGSPGGSTIITSVLQVFLNVVEFGMSSSEAVAAPRFHHQWLPDEIIYEPGCFSEAVADSLRQMGHTLREINGIGLVEVILRLPDGEYEGAADTREGSHAQGLDNDKMRKLRK